MVSKELVASLECFGFPFKLYRLATSAEIKSIRWTKCGNAFMIDPDTIKNECFKQEILNMTSIGEVYSRLKYYNFEEMNEKSEPRMRLFKHAYFKAGREDLLYYIKGSQSQKKANTLKASTENELPQDITVIKLYKESESQAVENAGIDAAHQENEVISSHHMKRRKVEISGKESDANQASIDNGSILNTGNISGTKKADIKLLNKTNKNIVNSTTGEIYTESLSNSFWAMPDGKNTLLQIQALKGTIYYNAGRKRFHGNADVPPLQITERYLLDCDSSTGSSNKHDKVLFAKNNVSFAKLSLPVNLTVLENKINENENTSSMPKMKLQKNTPDVFMKRDLSPSHIFRPNVKSHFDHKCQNKNLQNETRILGRNKDNNAVEFDCKHGNDQFYKQIDQELGSHNDLENKNGEIKKWDVGKNSFEKYQNVKYNNTLQNTETTTPQELNSKLSSESLCRSVVEQNSCQSSLLCIQNSEGTEPEANNCVEPALDLQAIIREPES
ncbi:hypothetical protein CEXT_75941 [Caerostris extrusa]|uniref:HSF-type DNA-binding domain-containing protein n=1 Tax=Caerostris extrusa TaxID=172846 RepID=A0AAV4NB14_CAEEX|nr:hypothetical protein CEXT_75941 [Caerostris extrusa]